MCGICGKLNFDHSESVDPELLEGMTAALQHRGPDGAGEYRAGPVGLGHRRLSIIDLATGSQPMCNEDGTAWLVFNGEIYNFPELRRELQARGHVFKSTTDTEVILHLYEEHGVDALNRLRGMFAFALWDETRQTLLLARDRVGIKPLYYSNTGRSLVFASEIKSILVDPEVSREINLCAIDTFLTYYYLPGTETLFQQIGKLPPGHYLLVRDGRVSVRQYWDLRFPASPQVITFDDAVEALRFRLRRTVQDHMISDVPVGVLLSGGVDSSGVLHYAAEQSARPIHTFTVGFAEKNLADERPYARLAAERYGTVHAEMSLSAADFGDFLPQYVWHMEEPVCEPPAVALFYVSRLARQSSVKVLLSGEGGDEAFGGYPHYRNLLLLESLKSRFGAARGLLRFGLNLFGRAGSDRASRYGSLVRPTLAEYYLSKTARPATGFNRRKGVLYNRDFVLQVNGHDSTAPTRRFFDELERESLLHQMLYVDTKTWLPDDLLVKADKMTMATSVELRVPLLDHELLEFAATLPSSFKVRGRTLKRILKTALEESVPREILNRKKAGFPVPYDRWLGAELRDYVADTLLGADAILGRYFERSELLKLVRGQQRGLGGAKEVFSLLVLELWHQQFPATPALRRRAAELTT